MQTTERLSAYLALFSEIDSADLSVLPGLVTPDFRFKDPFNDLRGPDGLEKILRETKANVVGASFEIGGLWRQDLSSVAIVKWRFTGQVRFIGRMDVTGLSELTLAEDGRVSSHIDYWDAADGLYRKIPLLGRVLASLRKRISLS